MITNYITKPVRVQAQQFDGTAESALQLIAAFALKGWFYDNVKKRPNAGNMIGHGLGEFAEPLAWFVKEPGRRVQVMKNGAFRRAYELPPDPQAAAARLIHKAITLARIDGYLTAGSQGPAILADVAEQLLLSTLPRCGL